MSLEYETLSDKEFYLFFNVFESHLKYFIRRIFRINDETVTAFVKKRIIINIHIY